MFLWGRVQLDAADSMPAQLDAKPTFNSLTFKLLFTNRNPNQLPGIESAASSWAISVSMEPQFRNLGIQHELDWHCRT